jgi:hypothetical protein
MLNKQISLEEQLKKERLELTKEIQKQSFSIGELQGQEKSLFTKIDEINQMNDHYAQKLQKYEEENVLLQKQLEQQTKQKNFQFQMLENEMITKKQLMENLTKKMNEKEKKIFFLQETNKQNTLQMGQIKAHLEMQLEMVKFQLHQAQSSKKQFVQEKNNEVNKLMETHHMECLKLQQTIETMNHQILNFHKQMECNLQEKVHLLTQEYEEKIQQFEKAQKQHMTSILENTKLTEMQQQLTQQDLEQKLFVQFEIQNKLIQEIKEVQQLKLNLQNQIDLLQAEKNVLEMDFLQVQTQVKVLLEQDKKTMHTVQIDNLLLKIKELENELGMKQEQIEQKEFEHKQFTTKQQNTLQQLEEMLLHAKKLEKNLLQHVQTMVEAMMTMTTTTTSTSTLPIQQVTMDTVDDQVLSCLTTFYTTIKQHQFSSSQMFQELRNIQQQFEETRQELSQSKQQNQRIEQQVNLVQDHLTKAIEKNIHLENQQILSQDEIEFLTNQKRQLEQELQFYETNAQ